MYPYSPFEAPYVPLPNLSSPQRLAMTGVLLIQVIVFDAAPKAGLVQQITQQMI